MALRPETVFRLIEGNAMPLLRALLEECRDAELMFLIGEYANASVLQPMSDAGIEVIAAAEDVLKSRGWERVPVGKARCGVVYVWQEDTPF